MTEPPKPEFFEYSRVIKRDEHGRFIGFMDEEVSDTKMWDLTDLYTEYEAKNTAEYLKYNKFSEWRMGIPVHPSFPFAVRLCIGFRPEKPKPEDTFRFDPIPKSWVFFVTEDPMLAPDGKLIKFQRAKFAIKTDNDIPGIIWNAFKYETHEDALKLLAGVKVHMKTKFPYYGDVNAPPLTRYAFCERCNYASPWEDGSVRGVPDTNVMLRPMHDKDYILHHDCGKSF